MTIKKKHFTLSVASSNFSAMILRQSMWRSRQDGHCVTFGWHSWISGSSKTRTVPVLFFFYFESYVKLRAPGVIIKMRNVMDALLRALHLHSSSPYRWCVPSCRCRWARSGGSPGTPGTPSTPAAPPSSSSTHRINTLIFRMKIAQHWQIRKQA